MEPLPPFAATEKPEQEPGVRVGVCEAAVGLRAHYKRSLALFEGKQWAWVQVVLVGVEWVRSEDPGHSLGRIVEDMAAGGHRCERAVCSGEKLAGGKGIVV